MIDPAIQYLISASASLLFLIAGLHKLANLREFQGIIDNYRLLPTSLTKVTVLLLGITEIALCGGWLITQSALIPLLSVALIGIYTLSISINLFRGRDYIDCGCSFSKFDKLLSQTTNPHLSFGLVVRNFTLIGLMLLAILPSNTRTLGTLDYLNMFFSFLCVVLVYAAANQLLRNNNAINSWRNVSE